MKPINYFLICCLLTPLTAHAWQWHDLWYTRDQQGAQLLKLGKPAEAAQVFHHRNWRAVANYRSGHYEQAYNQFNHSKTSSDSQYNAGNAAAFMEHYQEAIDAYDKAIALNPNNKDAITNRDIVKKLLQQKNQAQQNSQQQQKDQKNSSGQPSANNKPQSEAQQKDKSSQPKDMSSQKSKSQQIPLTKQQRQEENNKQLLRSLPDDPGGLLQQKFMRDYVKRHGANDYYQGIN